MVGSDVEIRVSARALADAAAGEPVEARADAAAGEPVEARAVGRLAGRALWDATRMEPPPHADLFWSRASAQAEKWGIGSLHPLEPRGGTGVVELVHGTALQATAGSPSRAAFVEGLVEGLLTSAGGDPVAALVEPGAGHPADAVADATPRDGRSTVLYGAPELLDLLRTDNPDSGSPEARGEGA